MFRWFWGRYVREFRTDRHCRDCLVGPPVAALSKVRPWAPDRVLTTLDRSRAEYIYICGGSRRGYGANLHVALVADPSAKWSIASPEIRMEIEGWRRLPIPGIQEELRTKLGLGDLYARCRCYQFGLEYFGGCVNGIDVVPGRRAAEAVRQVRT